jgi:hypothetical protein
MTDTSFLREDLATVEVIAEGVAVYPERPR